MRVFIYFNLHKHVFSVKALEGERKGKVIAHAAEVLIKDATLKVSQAGRARVLREKKKNVHAGVVGEWVHSPELNDHLLNMGIALTYNPYKYDSFVVAATEYPVANASFVHLTAANGRGKMISINPF